MNTLSSCRWTCKYTSLSPANWGKKQTHNYITHLMQKEPDSTGGFKDTTRLASDTRRSPPLSPFPSSWIYKKRKNEWAKEGKSRTFYQSASTWPMKIWNTCCIRATLLVVFVLLQYFPDEVTGGQSTKHLHYLHDYIAAFSSYLGISHSDTESSFLGKF